MTDTLTRWIDEMTAEADRYHELAERMDASGKMDAMAAYCREREAGCRAFVAECKNLIRAERHGALTTQMEMGL